MGMTSWIGVLENIALN